MLIKKFQMKLWKRSRKFFFITLLIAVIINILCSCGNNSMINNLKQNFKKYLIIPFPSGGSHDSLYSFDNKKVTPIKIKYQGRLSIFDKEKTIMYSVINSDSTRKDENQDLSYFNQYSLTDKKIISKNSIKNYNIDFYQVLDNTQIVITDGYTILKWDLINDKKMQLYKSDFYIKSFHIYDDNLIINEINSNKSDKNDMDECYTISLIDLNTESKKFLDYGSEISYSDEYNIIIYNNPVSKKIKLYYLNSDKYLITKAAINKFSIYTMLTEDLLLLSREQNDLFFKIIMLVTWLLPEEWPMEYYVYSISTGNEKVILKNKMGLYNLNPQILNYDPTVY